ncbi:hypothetical protein PIB30_072890, partial [Stylosanthes scabra]|nr:hypothetical protein [Stylosanthes scabra]
MPAGADDATLRQGLSWGSVVLAWTYRSLYNVATRDKTNIAGFIPLVLSWISTYFSAGLLQ